MGASDWAMERSTQLGHLMMLSRWAIRAVELGWPGCTLPIAEASGHHENHEQPCRTRGEDRQQASGSCPSGRRVSAPGKRAEAGAHDRALTALSTRRSRPATVTPPRIRSATRPSGATRNDWGGIVHAIADGDLLAGVDDRGPGGADLALECGRVCGRVAVDDAEHRDLVPGGMAVGELDELGRLGPTGRAPTGKEVHQHPTALELGERETPPVRLRPAAGGAGLPIRELDAVWVAAGRLARTATSTRATRPTPHAAQRASFNSRLSESGTFTSSCQR